MAKLLIIFGFIFAYVPQAQALDLPEPTYDDCFKLAEKAIQADVVGLEMEAATLAAKGLATPATLPPSASDSVTIKPLPGLDGSGDFETSLRQQGVRIVMDPTDPDGAPKVELDNVRFDEGGVTYTQPAEPAEEAEEAAPETEEKAEEGAEETEPAEPTAADIFEHNRTHCRIMYGVNF